MHAGEIIAFSLSSGEFEVSNVTLSLMIYSCPDSNQFLTERVSVRLCVQVSKCVSSGCVRV